MNDTVQNPQPAQDPQVVQPNVSVDPTQDVVNLAQFSQQAQKGPVLPGVSNVFSGVQPGGNINDNDISNKLNTFESVLDEIQNTAPHGLVQAVDEATDTLNPQSGAPRTAKERIELGGSVDAKQIDLGGGVQVVEQEKNPEIPVEVESFLQRVADHHETAPTEVIIADGTSEVSTNNYPSQPVIVLPITQEEEKKGARMSTKKSFRWLVEFSQKIIRMFTGKVIYRQEEK